MQGNTYAMDSVMINTSSSIIANITKINLECVFQEKFMTIESRWSDLMPLFLSARVSVSLRKSDYFVLMAIPLSFLNILTSYPLVASVCS